MGRRGDEIIFKTIKYLFIIIIGIFCQKLFPQEINKTFLQIKPSIEYISKNLNVNEIFDSPDSLDWIKISSVDAIKTSKSINHLWIRFKLPELSYQNPSLYIGSVDQIFETYLSGKTIYQFGDFDNIGKKSHSHMTVHLIPLPEKYEGNYIYFHIYSDIHKIGISGPFYIGSDKQLMSNLFWNSWDEITFSILFIVSGFILLFAFLFIIKENLILGIAIYLLSFGLWTLCNTIFVQLVNSKVYLLYVLDNISLVGFGIGIYYMVEKIHGIKYKRFIRKVWQTFTVILVLRILLEFLTPISFDNTLNFYVILFGLSNIIGLLIILLSLSKDKPEVRLFLIGLGGNFIFGITEILIYYSNWWKNSPKLIHYGSGFFTFVAFFIVFNRYKLMTRQKEQATKRELAAVEKEKNTRQLYTQKLLNMQEEEWKRISYELHDSVGQDLLVVKNLIQHGRKNNIDVIQDDKLYDIINSTSTKAINELKDISRALHPVQLEKLGLTQSIHALINKISKTNSLNFATNVENIDELMSKDKEIQFYRIIQESLNNVIKHAQAEMVLLSIKREDNSINLIIKDNGKGFNVNTNYEGFGLRSIAERTTLLKGTINIHSNINSGTELKVEVPV